MEMEKFLACGNRHIWNEIGIGAFLKTINFEQELSVQLVSEVIWNERSFCWAIT